MISGITKNPFSVNMEAGEKEDISEDTGPYKLYSKWEVFKYNYFIWTPAFFLGLQLTHLDKGVLKTF